MQSYRNKKAATGNRDKSSQNRWDYAKKSYMEHSPKNKQNTALLQLHAAEKHKPVLCVRGIFSAEVLIADESHNKGPGHTSCFRGKRKGCPWQAKDMAILQADWGYSVLLPSSQGPVINLSESLAPNTQQACSLAAPQLKQTFQHQTPSDSKVQTCSAMEVAPESTQAQQHPTEALWHLLSQGFTKTTGSATHSSLLPQGSQGDSGPPSQTAEQAMHRDAEHSLQEHPGTF